MCCGGTKEMTTTLPHPPTSHLFGGGADAGGTKELTKEVDEALPTGRRAHRPLRTRPWPPPARAAPALRAARPCGGTKEMRRRWTRPSQRLSVSTATRATHASVCERQRREGREERERGAPPGQRREGREEREERHWDKAGREERRERGAPLGQRREGRGKRGEREREEPPAGGV